MNIDPTDAAAGQVPVTHELDDFEMRDGDRAREAIVESEEVTAAPAAVSREEFSINQLVPDDLIESKQPVELPGVGGAVGQETNPDRSIDQDH